MRDMERLAAYNRRMLTAPAAFPAFAPATIAPLRRIIEAAGLRVDRMLTSAGLTGDFFEPSDGRAARLSDYFRLTEQIALSIGDESVHVSLRPLMLGTSEFIKSRLREARTIGEMMTILADSYNVIPGARYNRVRVTREEIVFVMDDSSFPYALDKDDPFILFSLEGLLVYIQVLLQSSSVGAEPLPWLAIRTRRRAGGGPDASVLGFWGVPVIDGATYFALHFDRAAAAWPVEPGSCPVLGSRTVYGGIARALDRLEAPSPAADDIVERVRDAFRAEPAEQDEIAARLGMSVASLRRRLAERGTSFRELRAGILREAAEARLREGAPVADIAVALGFSDGRSFARAFRGWTGLSPNAYRAIEPRVSEFVPR